MDSLSLAFALAWLRRRRRTKPEVGDRAPLFALPDQDATLVRLQDLLGRRNVVLAFHIKAFTSG